MKKTKPPKEKSQLLKNAFDLSKLPNGPIQEYKKNLHAVELGRLGGLKGGKARADKLSKAQRIKIAKKAANARWNKN